MLTAIALVFVFLPLVVLDPWGWASFGPIKWLVVSAGGFATAAVLLSRGFTIARRWAIGWLAFLGVAVVAALVGLDPIHAWIGTPDRHLGVIAWLLFGVAFVAGSQLDGRVVARAATVTAAVIAAYAMAEALGWELVEIVPDSERLGSTLGNASYLGAALALLLPIAIGLAIDDPRWRWPAGGISALGLVAVAGSQSRAAWVGLAVAAAFSAPRWWPLLRRHRQWFVGVGAVGVVLVALSPVPDRVASTFDLDDPGTSGRIDEWQLGLSALAERPLLGAGPEGYRVLAPAHIDADYEMQYGREVSPDRAHNSIIDVALSFGLGGLLLWGAAMAALIAAAWDQVRRGPPWAAGLAAGVIAYIGQQLFLFPLAEVDPAFWLVAGVLVTTSASDRISVGAQLPVAAGVGVLAAAVAAAGILDIGADHRADETFERFAEFEFPEAVTAARSATELRPDSIRYRVIAAQAEANAFAFDADAYDRAVAQIDAALDVSPRDPILRRLRALWLLSKAEFTSDEFDIATARTAVLSALERDPNSAHLRYGLGVAELFAGNYAAAEESLLIAEALSPDTPSAAATLALLYDQLGETDAALDALARAEAVDPDDPLVAEARRRIG